MLKKLVIISIMVVCCYCEVETSTNINTNVILPEESRAKKKKNKLKLLAMIALFVLSKVVIIKAATFFFFLALFQKLFSVGGVLLTYLMKNQLANVVAPSPAPAPAASPPSTSYGSPVDYNTIGYSYGPPEHEAAFEGPSIADFGGPFNWILQKP